MTKTEQSTVLDSAELDYTYDQNRAEHCTGQRRVGLYICPKQSRALYWTAQSWTIYMTKTEKSTVPDSAGLDFIYDQNRACRTLYRTAPDSITDFPLCNIFKTLQRLCKRERSSQENNFFLSNEHSAVLDSSETFKRQCHDKSKA